MTLKENITQKAKEIYNTAFEIKDINFIPNVDTKHEGLTFGCKGVKLPVTVLYIDMRDSTRILDTHNRNVVAKIHMTYYHAIVKVVSADGGQVRSFNGDSLLVFFYGIDVNTVRNAVRCAFKIRYALTDIVNTQLTTYTNINFGIGVDCGDVIATKVGVGGNEDNKDLIWIGNAVNCSTRISDECQKPCYVGISQRVYDKLDEPLLNYKETRQTMFGPYTQELNVWEKVLMHNKDYNEYIYKSSCVIKIV